MKILGYIILFIIIIAGLDSFMGSGEPTTDEEANDFITGEWRYQTDGFNPDYYDEFDCYIFMNNGTYEHYILHEKNGKKNLDYGDWNIEEYQAHKNKKNSDFMLILTGRNIPSTNTYFKIYDRKTISKQILTTHGASSDIYRKK